MTLQLKFFLSLNGPGPYSQQRLSHFRGKKKKKRSELMQCAMQLVLSLNELAGASWRWIVKNRANEVLPGKRPVLASLSSVLLQVVSGLLRYNCEKSSHQILACNKGLLCCFDTTVLPHCSYNCNLNHLDVNKDQWELDSTLKNIFVLPSHPYKPSSFS